MYDLVQDFSPTNEKEIHKREVLLLSCYVKRRRSINTSSIDISPMIKKVDGCFLLFIASSQMERI